MRKALVFISEIRALSALLFLIGLLDSNDTLELLTDADRSSVSNFSSSALLAIDFISFVITGLSLRFSKNFSGLLIVLLFDLFKIFFF